MAVRRAALAAAEGANPGCQAQLQAAQLTVHHVLRAARAHQAVGLAQRRLCRAHERALRVWVQQAVGESGRVGSWGGAAAHHNGAMQALRCVRAHQYSARLLRC